MEGCLVNGCHAPQPDWLYKPSRLRAAQALFSGETSRKICDSSCKDNAKAGMGCNLTNIVEAIFSSSWQTGFPCSVLSWRCRRWCRNTIHLECRIPWHPVGHHDLIQPNCSMGTLRCNLARGHQKITSYHQDCLQVQRIVLQGKAIASNELEWTNRIDSLM